MHLSRRCIENFWMMPEPFCELIKGDWESLCIRRPRRCTGTRESQQSYNITDTQTLIHSVNEKKSFCSAHFAFVPHKSKTTVKLISQNRLRTGIWPKNVSFFVFQRWIFFWNNPTALAHIVNSVNSFPHEAQCTLTLHWQIWNNHSTHETWLRCNIPTRVRLHRWLLRLKCSTTWFRHC